jgi:ligand-binding sensor domain-containing protein
LANSSVTTVWEDRHGRLWLGGYQAVSRYDDQTFTHYQVDAEKNVWAHAAYAFCEDRQGRLWMANYKGDVKRFDGEEWTDVIVGDWRFGENYARALVEDDAGGLWIANGGICAYRYAGEELTAYTSADGLVEDAVRCILKDRRGGCGLPRKGAA